MGESDPTMKGNRYGPGPSLSTVAVSSPGPLNRGGGSANVYQRFERKMSSRPSSVFAACAQARKVRPCSQRGRAPIAAQRGTMPQPEKDLRECLEVGFIGTRYGRLEVVHDDRFAEGIPPK